jgi:hypothetical protein
MRRLQLTAALTLLSVAPAAAAADLPAFVAVTTASGAAERVVVPHQNPETSPDYRYKPKRLTLPAYGDGDVVLSRLKWRSWGTAKATATGRLRAGDPDNGYTTTAVRVSLSGRRRDGCGDVTRRQYTRAVIRDAPILGGTATFTPLLIC